MEIKNVSTQTDCFRINKSVSTATEQFENKKQHIGTQTISNIISPEDKSENKRINKKIKIISNIVINSQNNSSSSVENSKPKKRLLTLCDGENHKIIHQAINSFNENDFTSLTIKKPGALYDQVTSDIKNLAKDFTLCDYILLSAGAYDFFNGKYPTFRYISTMVQMCPNTNFIFGSVPRTRFNSQLNKKIDKFNSALKNFVHRLDYYSEGSIHFMDISNQQIVDLKTKEIVTSNRFKVNKNLKHITVTQNVPSDENFQIGNLAKLQT